MKKRKLMCAAALVALTLGSVSCLDSNGEYYDHTASVRPGIYIYNAAHSQNEAAMQPADIALRLAILRAEAVKQGKADDLSSVTVNGQPVQTLLFGMNTKIEKEETEAGTYLIEYRNSGGQRPYDSYTRTGKVRVRTHDTALEQTDDAKRWSVTLDSERLTVTGGQDVKIVTTGDTYIYYKEGAYEIGFANALSEADDRKANWSGTFTWTPEKKGELAFSSLAGASFELDGSAQGTSFWSFNGVSAAGMKYAVTDGKYQPSRTGSASKIMGGTEECGLTASLDYNIADYPSPDVKVVWTVAGNALSYAVTYNGSTVNF